VNTGLGQRGPQGATRIVQALQAASVKVVYEAERVILA
jgi:hypothetical protein